MWRFHTNVYSKTFTYGLLQNWSWLMSQNVLTDKVISYKKQTTKVHLVLWQFHKECKQHESIIWLSTHPIKLNIYNQASTYYDKAVEAKLQFKFNICRSRFSVCPVANQSMYKLTPKDASWQKENFLNQKPGADYIIKIKYYKNIQKRHPSIFCNINFSQNSVCIQNKIKLSFL